MELVLQLIRTDDTWKILRHCRIQIVIDIGMCLCINHRNEDNDKDHQNCFIMSCQKARKLFRFL